MKTINNMNDFNEFLDRYEGLIIGNIQSNLRKNSKKRIKEIMTAFKEKFDEARQKGIDLHFDLDGVKFLMESFADELIEEGVYER